MNKFDGYNVCFDWLTATFVIPEDRDAFERIDFLEILFDVLTFNYHTFDECENIHKQKGGFAKYTTLGEFIEILYDGSYNGAGEKVSQLDMSGEACREFEDRGGNWLVILSYLASIDANFTRLDIAIDDYSGLYSSLPKIVDKVQKRELVTLFRTWSYKNGGNLSTNTFTENTLYMGSPQSDAMVRIYDKLLERTDKGYELDFVKFWTRYEMQFRHDRAKAFVLELIKNYDSFPHLASSVLYSYLDFKENTGKTRIKNENTCDWWIQFIGNVDKTFLKNQGKLESSITKKKSWHSHSVTKPELQIFLSGPEKFLEFIMNGLEEKFPDFKEKDFAVINNELRRQGYKQLDKTDFKQLLDYYKEKYLKKDEAIISLFHESLNEKDVIEN